LWHFVKTTAISFFSMNWTYKTRYISHFKHLRNKTGLNLADKRRILMVSIKPSLLQVSSIPRHGAH
jgi:hypothetical protein